MPESVRDRIRSDRAAWAALTARASEPEPESPEGIGVVAGLVDSERDPFYSDGVQHPSESRWTEAERQAFLRRAQRVDPRERRA